MKVRISIGKRRIEDSAATTHVSDEMLAAIPFTKSVATWDVRRTDAVTRASHR
jgi:hypothetical protein